MDIVSTIIPIFTVILIGWIARKNGFIPVEFINPANRLVYYIAIPAMIFKSVAQTDFGRDFNGPVLIITLATMVVVFAVALTSGMAGGLRSGRLATYTQTTFHCNIGYMALAVAYYYLGEDGFARASIIAGFVMILQNFLSVLVLQSCGEGRPTGSRLIRTVSSIVANPIILSAAAGIACSVSTLPIPVVILRTFDVLGGLALPTALLIIGASLSFSMLKRQMKLVAVGSSLKLALMPGLGIAAFTYFGLSSQDYLPAVILIASPSATVIYVMAKEMGGDVDLAIAAVSVSTLISSVSFSIWLAVISHLG